MQVCMWILYSQYIPSVMCTVDVGDVYSLLLFKSHDLLIYRHV